MGRSKRWQSHGMWSGRRRSAKTGRLSSAPATPKLRLAETLLLRKDLLHDFLLYVDAASLVELCNAMADVPRTCAVLLDRSWWRHLLQEHCSVNLTSCRIHRSVNVVTGHATEALEDYLSLRSQSERFERHVHVERGDLGAVTSVGDEQVDCLVFPTSASFRNPHVGVAGRVHERAGPDLDRAVANLGRRDHAQPGSVLCTVGCSSGVRLLVHAVGPSGGLADSETLLYKAYVNALLAADSNHVKCAAFASISTGLLRFPVPRAADIAMSALRDLIRVRPHWSVRVGFVCIDSEVLQQFQRARGESFQAFHTSAFAFPRLVEELSMAEPEQEA
jgi:O-acetyl-ADP-ribose deacetylase (regulator of RNase III)